MLKLSADGGEPILALTNTSLQDHLSILHSMGCMAAMMVCFRPAVYEPQILRRTREFHPMPHCAASHNTALELPCGYLCACVLMFVPAQEGLPVRLELIRTNE